MIIRIDIQTGQHAFLDSFLSPRVESTQGFNHSLYIAYKNTFQQVYI